MHPYAIARTRSAARKPAESTMSAARAAAEAAFMGRSEMLATPKPSEAVVVLRRKARPAEASAPALRPAIEFEAELAVDAASAQRAPRVFRMPETEAPGQPAASTQQAAMSPEALPAVPRAERVGHDKRAGEIRLLRPEPAPASEPQVELVELMEPVVTAPAPSAAMVSEQLRLLAELEPVFALIRKAQAFRLDDDMQAQAEWQRIEAATHRLALDLTLLSGRRAPYEQAFRGFL